MHDDGHQRGGQPHRPGSLLMVQAREMAQGEGLLIAGAEGVERLAQLVQLVRVLDAVEIVDGHHVVGPVCSTTTTVAAAPPLASLMVDELVAGDVQEPRGEATGSPPESIEPGQGPFERCRREVFGELGVTTPSEQEPMHGVDMESVQRGERIDIGARPFDELLLVERTGLEVGVHRPPA